eukprot:TRINITY_DN104_c0_g1_i1.p1 TRINITY_DN104_c0_g1~~TRINITY_DN104_c0_g1_i1.p1  ORF type:complete len:262 (-),score=58.79 TRINITY_DN104_c0_g1_i1:28-771(-)
MKAVIVCLLLCFIVAVSSASVKKSTGVRFASAPQKNLPGSPGTFCSTCVQFMSEAIDELLNIIANAGVLGGCNALCSLLPPIYDNLDIIVCNGLCDVVGIEAFVDLINVTDPDPIWMCMELDGTCPINDNAAANITSVTVHPESGPQGTTFQISMTYHVTNTIGTGEGEFVVVPPQAMPFGDGGLLVYQTPGMYSATLSFTASPSENEPFLPGQYYVQAAVCEGSCGSIHSHSKVLSVRNGQFKITQ